MKRPHARADDRPCPEAGCVVAVEQIRDGQHDHRDRDRLEQPETGEAQRLLSDPVEAVVDLHPQDPPEQVRAEP